MAIGTGLAIIGSTIAGAAISSNAAKSAARTQADATRQASDATLQAQREALDAQKPFLEGGYAATNRLQELLGLGGNTSASGYGSLNTPFSFKPGDLTQTPGYQFQLQQGQNAIDRRAAAGGGFYSGAGLKGAASFNQDLAGTTFDKEYGRAFNEFQANRANTLNPLQALAGQGQTAANTSGSIQMGGANSLAGLLTSNANAQGASRIAQGNAISSGINNGLAAWQRAQYMNAPGSSAANWGVGTSNPWGGSSADPWYG
jgi:hypothetical protein